MRPVKIIPFIFGEMDRARGGEDGDGLLWDGGRVLRIASILGICLYIQKSK